MMPSEINKKLEALQTWYAMLEEAQMTTAIYRLIQLTTLTRLHFLTEALKMREMELVIHEGAMKYPSRVITRTQVV